MKAVIYNIKSREQYDNLKNILADIASKDSTFEWQEDSEGMRFFIFDEDLNHLHKRCTWIVFKADKEKTIVYQVMRDEK